MRDGFVRALLEVAAVNNNFMLLTADLGYGIFDEFRELYPDRFLNVGVAEQNMIGVASGMALVGFDVIAYSIANFSFMRCLEQLRNDAAYHSLNVNIVGSGSGFTYGQLGVSHHATEDIGVLKSLPQIELYAPVNNDDARRLVHAVLERPGCSYIRLEKDGYAAAPEFDRLGSLRCVFDVKNAKVDAVVFVIGQITEVAVFAAKQLERDGLFVRVINCHMIKPLCNKSVINLLMESEPKLVVTVEEHAVCGGFGDLIARIIIESHLTGYRFISFGLPDYYASVTGSQDYLRGVSGLTVDNLRTQIKAILNP